MRNMLSANGLSVYIVAGTHVVLLGFNLRPEKHVGCLGFAIQREDLTEDERYWLKGTKIFEIPDIHLKSGDQVSSYNYPFQTFQWSDYTAKPDHNYIYTVIPRYGTPQTS